MVKVLDSWIYTGRLLIAEIKYSGKGLFKGTRLVSKSKTSLWIVNSRLIFNHTMGNQARFIGETETPMSLKFANEKAKDNSQKDILDKENIGIYQ